MTEMYDSQSHFVNMQPNGFRRVDTKPNNSPALVNPGESRAQDKYRKEPNLPKINGICLLREQIERDIQL